MNFNLKKENEDGSAEYTFEYTEKEYNELLALGLHLVMVPPVQHCEELHTEATEALIKLATLTRIVRGLEAHEKEADKCSSTSEQTSTSA